MPNIKFACKCGLNMTAPQSMAGDFVDCPKCKASVRVPSLPAAPPNLSSPLPSPLPDPDPDSPPPPRKPVHRTPRRRKKSNTLIWIAASVFFVAMTITAIVLATRKGGSNGDSGPTPPNKDCSLEEVAEALRTNGLGNVYTYGRGRDIESMGGVRAARMGYDDKGDTVTFVIIEFKNELIAKQFEGRTRSEFEGDPRAAARVDDAMHRWGRFVIAFEMPTPHPDLMKRIKKVPR